MPSQSRGFTPPPGKWGDDWQDPWKGPDAAVALPPPPFSRAASALKEGEGQISALLGESHGLQPLPGGPCLGTCRACGSPGCGLPLNTRVGWGGVAVGVGEGRCLAAAIVTLMITMMCHLSCRQAVNGPSLHTCARLCWGLGQGHTP